MSVIHVVRPCDPSLTRLLEGHPGVEVLASGDSASGELRFGRGSWSRRVVSGDLQPEVRGLVELIDNNPMVCADEVAVPSAAGTLALIAFGPLARAGLLAEAPTLLTTFPADEEDVSGWLETAGWAGGVSVAEDAVDLGDVRSAHGAAAIDTPVEWSDLDALYDEAFGRSFFVRRDEDSAWSATLVVGTPRAVYRLRVTPGADRSLVAIQVQADARGKCGAAQMVHAMNVMAGFEESLGLD